MQQKVKLQAPRLYLGNAEEHPPPLLPHSLPTLTRAPNPPSSISLANLPRPPQNPLQQLTLRFTRHTALPHISPLPSPQPPPPLPPSCLFGGRHGDESWPRDSLPATTVTLRSIKTHAERMMELPQKDEGVREKGDWQKGKMESPRRRSESLTRGSGLRNRGNWRTLGSCSCWIWSEWGLIVRGTGIVTKNN